MRLTRIATIVLFIIPSAFAIACDSSSTSKPTTTPTYTVVPTSTPISTSTPTLTTTSTLIHKSAAGVLCFEGCPLRWVGDGECDSCCNIEQCNWDDGDCPTPTPTPIPTPTPTPTPMQTPIGAQLYEQDRAAIQAAVYDYRSDHDQEIPYLQDPGEIEGLIIWLETPSGSCCLIDVCKLIPDYLPSIPQSCSNRTSINDVDNCGVREDVYYGCSGCHTSSHYVWVMTASGEVSSVYYDIPGDSWAAPIIQDGYQGVYP